MDEEEEVLKSFGEHVRVLRQNAQLSQEQLAHKCRLDRTYISGIERGRRNISLINLIKVSAALGVHPQQLLEFWNETQ